MKYKFAVVAAIAAFVIFPPAAMAQKEKPKADLFKEIVKLSQSKKDEDKKKAYGLSKEYMTRFGSEDSEDMKKVRDFAGKYRTFLFFDAIKKTQRDQAFAIGREMLKDNPDDLMVMMNLAFEGYAYTEKWSDAAFANEVAGYSQRSIEMLEAGNVKDNNFEPFTDKNAALGYLNFYVGHFNLNKDKKVSAVNFYRSTQVEGPLKDAAAPYIGIADYYEDAYRKFSTELNVKRSSMSDAEIDAAAVKNDKIVDAMLDAYARGVKRAEAEKNPQAAVWKARLAQIYTYRKKSEAGLADYISAIDKTPMPNPADIAA